MIATAENSIDHIYTKKVQDLHFRNLSVCPVETPVFEVARLMAKDKISCFFIGNSGQEILGFVTDITLRDKVIAQINFLLTPRWE
jgi:CBS domain-containing protein